MVLVVQWGDQACRVCWSRVPSTSLPASHVASSHTDRIALQTEVTPQLPRLEMDPLFAAALGLTLGSKVRENHSKISLQSQIIMIWFFIHDYDVRSGACVGGTGYAAVSPRGGPAGICCGLAHDCEGAKHFCPSIIHRRR